MKDMSPSRPPAGRTPAEAGGRRQGERGGGREGGREGAVG